MDPRNVDRTNLTAVLENLNATLSGTVACYSGVIDSNNGVMINDNPLSEFLPLFVKQLTVIVFVSRCVVLLLSRLRLPRILVELLGVFVTGPFVLGRWAYFATWILPTTDTRIWSTMTHFGLMFHAFNAGLESDTKAVSNPSNAVFTVAVAGMAIPFIAGFSLYYLAGGSLLPPTPHSDLLGIGHKVIGRKPAWVHRGATYCGAALACTEFSSVAQSLARHKLLHSDIGRTAMGATMITEIATWMVLGVGIPFSLSAKSLEYAVLCGVPLWYLCHHLLGPALAWLVLKVSDGKPEITEARAGVALSVMMMGGFAANLAGMHPMIGAYLVGLGVPHRVLRNTLVEKFDQFVSGIVLPLVFGILILMIDPICFTDYTKIRFKVLRFLGVCTVAGVAKLGTVAVIARFQKVSIRDSIILGTILSNKNILSIILLYIGLVLPNGNISAYGKRVNTPEVGFVIGTMVAALLITVVATELILKTLAMPSRRNQENACRNLESQIESPELRILTPIYNSQDVPGLIALLQLTTTASPSTIIALRLNELTAHSAANLFIQTLQKPDMDIDSDTHDEDTQIFEAFRNFDDEYHGGSSGCIHLLTNTSPYDTMHKDVCGLSNDECVALIIVPFHQQRKLEMRSGEDEDESTSVQGVNQSILAEAPCSVGIFVDRNLAEIQTACTRVAVLFVGGPDDREALFYGWRVRGHPGVSLSVTRFILGDESSDLEKMGTARKQKPILRNAAMEYEREKEVDDLVMAEFRMRAGEDEKVSYNELVSNNGEDTVTAIMEMEHDYDLYIVGKGERFLSPLTMGLNDWSDWPELGPVGDLIVTSEFGKESSVIVMQQHVAKVGSKSRIKDFKLLKKLSGHK